MKIIRSVFAAVAAVVTVALNGMQAHGQVRPPGADSRLDLFLEALHPQSAVAAGRPAMTVSQDKLEQLLRILMPATVGHGATGSALSQSQQTVTMPSQDPSIYGFCYESCQTARAVSSCGT